MCSTCQKWLSDRKLGLSTVARCVVRFSKETWKLDRFFFEKLKLIASLTVSFTNRIMPTRSLSTR